MMSNHEAAGEAHNEETSNLLEGADVRSINELFAADPLSLSDTDIDQIVVELRAQRERWEKEGKAAKIKKPKKSLSIDELDLDIQL